MKNQYNQDDNLIYQDKGQKSIAQRKRSSLNYIQQKLIEYESGKQTNFPVNLFQDMKKMTVLLSFLTLMALVLTFSFFYKQIFQNIMLQLNLVRTQEHAHSSFQTKLKKTVAISGGDQQFYIKGSTLLESIYNFCPEQNSTFHTYYDQNDDQMIGLQAQAKTKAKRCKIPILGSNDLQRLKKKWNVKYPQDPIKLSLFQTNQQRQTLLIFLQLYFNAGTYLNTKIPYYSIDNRCWQYILTGFDILYIDFKEKDEKQFYIPDHSKFMKLRFPYSPEIKAMIRKLVHKEDFLSMCRQRQCLIVRCQYI